MSPNIYFLAGPAHTPQSCYGCYMAPAAVLCSADDTVYTFLKLVSVWSQLSAGYTTPFPPSTTCRVYACRETGDEFALLHSEEKEGTHRRAFPIDSCVQL